MPREYAGFIISSDTQITDTLHGWVWTWDAFERSEAFGLNVAGCWVSQDPKGGYRRMPPWPGSQGFVPTSAQVAAEIKKRGLCAG